MRIRDPEKKNSDPGFGGSATLSGMNSISLICVIVAEKPKEKNYTCTVCHKWAILLGPGELKTPISPL